jgi:hypothetical protein
MNWINLYLPGLSLYLNKFFPVQNKLPHFNNLNGRFSGNKVYYSLPNVVVAKSSKIRP